MKTVEAIKFFELLENIVNSQNGQTYIERKDELLSHASEQDKNNLEEFMSWFD
jgi:hypothetical protein